MKTMKRKMRAGGVFAAILICSMAAMYLTGCDDDTSGDGGGGGKSPGAAVSAPTLNSKNSNSITINAATFTAENPGSQTIEYGRNTSNTAPTSWQDGVTFSGLNADTTYYIFARSKANTTHNAGTPSTGLSVTTEGIVSTPITNVLAGIVSYGTEILLSTTTVGATIYYTTDGNDPTVFSPEFSDSSPIIINAPTTIKAIATASGMTVSAVMTAAYTTLGGTGPGGGIIFYWSEEGFIMTDTGETCHYLEAAPSDMPERLAWASSSYTSYDILAITTDSSWLEGAGRKNTALILEIDANAPAAKACSDYTNNGKSDWFLPSVYELMHLYVNRNSVGNMVYDFYWSSSQNISTSSYGRIFTDGESDMFYSTKTNTYSVRAIRAF